ncbi:MAG: ATP-binding protein [Desulfobulbaceae bacterium]|nr:ATP-binding protein [Desulfobulbaceae bacterium]
MTPVDKSVQEQLAELQETVAGLKKDKARLEEIAQQADAANKAKSDFLAMISHEIRTPMNGVIGLTELLLDTELENKQKHYAGLILTSARNLLTLINSLLDFSKIEARMMELDIAEFSLRKLTSEMMSLYNVATERKDVLVSAEIDPRVAETYMGDSYRIRQILVNLLGNAIKFTEQGSVLVKIIYVRSTEAGRDLLRIEVRDSGPGIPSDKLDRLFKPFSQVDASSTRRHGGTGLGLSICQKLVELMGGEIGVESVKEKGSTFWFVLPLKPVAAQPQDDPGALKSGGPAAWVRPGTESLDQGAPAETPLIMIVDDDETNRFVLETVLEKSGARVVSARNGKEAIDLFLSNTPDLILMDCQMPVVDGFEACQRIHGIAAEKSGKRPCIIALTADATQSTRQRCREVGMDDYLTKPLDFVKLQRVVDNWLPGSGLRVVGRRHGQQADEGAPFVKDDAFQGMRIDPQVLQRLKDNMGDISPVIKVFLGSLPGRLKELKKAADASDHEAVRRIAHILKGSSSQFGALHMSSLCLQAESMAKNRKMDTIHVLCEKISEAADQLDRFLSEELDKK